jgi:hypothetical protein
MTEDATKANEKARMMLIGAAAVVWYTGPAFLAPLLLALNQRLVHFLIPFHQRLVEKVY